MSDTPARDAFGEATRHATLTTSGAGRSPDIAHLCNACEPDECHDAADAALFRGAADRVEAAEAERDRLSVEIDNLNCSLVDARQERDEARAENERLREALSDIAEATDQFGPHMNYDLHTVARSVLSEAES